MRILYYGHVGSLSGYGRAAADNCMALLSTGKVELEIGAIDYRADQARIALAGAKEVLVPRILRPGDQPAEHDVVIIHTLPQDLPRAYATIDPSAPCVAYTTWEGYRVPPDLLALYDVFDQIWVPSEHCATAFRSDDIDDRVRTIPHAFDVETVEPRRMPRPLEDGFRFYYVGAWNSRKNPAGLLRAWAAAFTKDDPHVSLTMHCPGVSADQFVIALHQTGVHPDDMAPVVLSNKHVSEDAIWKMHASHDCFVTASRGEAWNLPCFDALLARRHVIAPRQLGSAEYLQGTTAATVGGMAVPCSVDVQVVGGDGARNFQLQTVGAQGLSARSTWIEPNLIDLACAMRHAYETGTRFIDFPPDLLTRFSYRSVGELALQTLEDL